MTGRRRDERGVSLVLVLVTLVVFGLLVPILGQFGSTNGVSGYLVEGQRYDRYAAEAGVQEAIAWTQANRAAGRHGVPCGGIQTGTLGTGNAARSATVKCQGYKDGGIPQATADAPRFALQATGTGGNAVDLRDGGRYRTNGAWWSNAGISASGLEPSLDYVGASRSCGSIQAAPKECDQNRTEAPPDWNVVPGAAPAAVDLVREERCTGGNHVIRIAAGFHWQRSYFDMVADGDPQRGCGGGYVLWLAPGLHVFDFDFYGAVNSPSLRAAGPVVVVGGEPSGWDENGGGNQFAAARAAVRSRTACDPKAAGATVVMAGASYFELNPEGNASVDTQICGAPVNGSGAIPVSFAQVTHGSNPVDATGTASPTSVGTDGHGVTFGWQAPPLPTPPAANPLASRECSTPEGPACDPAHVMFGRLTGDRALGTVTMTTPDPVPAGARLKTLTLTINHQEEQRDGGIDRLRLYVTGLGDVANQFCDFTRADHRLDPNDAWPRANENVDVFTCDARMFDDARRPYVPSGQPVRIVYEAQLDRNDRDREDRRASADLAIDQVRLDATFQRPTYRPSTPTGSPWILQVNQGARATFDGVVYTPTGDVLFDWARSTENGFRRGAIVRSIRGENLPNDPNYSPFELPGGGSYTDRVVTFAAAVSGSDQSGAMLTARVLFCDPVSGLGPPARNPKCTGEANQQPVVLAWQTRR